MQDVENRLRALEWAVSHSNPGNLTTTEAVTLRDYIEAKLEAVDRQTQAAAQTMDKRLDGMNEFRETLRDQASKFVTRAELTIQIDRLTDRQDELRTFKNRLEGKASAISVYIAYAIAIIGIVLNIIGYLR